MTNIDQYVYANNLLEVHPAEKIFLAIATMIVCLISTSIYTPLIAMTIMAGLIIFKAGIPYKFFIHFMLIPITFLMIGELAIAFSISNQSGGYLFHFALGGTFSGLQFRI